MECFDEFQILRGGGDFAVEMTTLLFEVVKSDLVGVDALFQADENAREFFQGQLSQESMLALYACLHDKSIESAKNMACTPDNV
jgi:hypothetical protein